MTFSEFRDAIQYNFGLMAEESNNNFFVTDVSKEEIWDKYLAAYDESERQEFNCNCCKSFLRKYGNIVIITDDMHVKSMWRCNVGDEKYQKVADELATLVESKQIANKFVTDQNFVSKGQNVTRAEAKDRRSRGVVGLGVHSNLALNEDGNAVRWNHFYVEVDPSVLNSSGYSNETIMGNSRTAAETLRRSLNELTDYSVEVVLDLIAQGSLYRGTEFKAMLEEFAKLKAEYSEYENAVQHANFCWIKSGDTFVSRMRNSVIGTLLIDISEGVDLETAVRKYESKVAPANYKRPKALVTKRMVKQAQEHIANLGYTESLPRRYATLRDITVNNTLFTDRAVRQSMEGMDIFAEMISEVKEKPKNFNNVEEIGIQDFIDKVLPRAQSLEVLFEGKHEQNLCSFVAPVHTDAPSMFKWDNGFSWDYKGNVTDSLMKERVKAAGGKVDGVLRFSIQWNEEINDPNIDFDAHCKSPTHHIYYSSRICSTTGGNLDVDITNPSNSVAVENITWPQLNRMRDGEYEFYLHNFSRSRSREGFSAEIEFNDQVFKYRYDDSLIGNQTIKVATVTLRNGQFTIKHHLPANGETISKEIWNIDTNKFHKVKLMTLSPNHWDDNGVGNKHFFFVLNDCRNDERTRGFYNEFLKNDLITSKKFFEALGSKMIVPDSDEQLSGLGFSETKRAELVVRVTGATKRLLKIKF